jgi:phenylalanyl-tRNA synthetase beta chain
MPDGTRLKQAKLRGQESDGMILAEDERPIGVEHDGIMVLDAALAAGTPLADVLPIATDVLELEITPNRPTASASTASRARSTRRPGRRSPRRRGATDPHPAGDAIPGFSRRGAAPDLCPRFTARLFEDVTIGPVAGLAEGAPDGAGPAARSTTSSTSRTT